MKHESNIVQTQKIILSFLVSEGKLTGSQASSLPPAESMESIIPDIIRISGNEESVCSAVAKALKRRQFVEIEEGRRYIVPPGNEQFVIYDGTAFMPNPLDRKTSEQAMNFARRNSLGSNLSLGVISSTKLDGLRANSLDNEDEVAADDETNKRLAQKRIDEMIREAAAKDATDIHLQPTQGDRIQVRYRIDGKLKTMRTYPNALHNSVLRVVVENMCSLTLETVKPQDGKFDFELSPNKRINVRVSSIPALQKSDKSIKLVLRLLGNNTKLSNLRDLGMDPRNLAILQRIGNEPNGMIVLTGPTGSGKTTTNNAVLLDSYRNNPNRNFHTIEEPVEIMHEGMTHTECGEHLSFADALRALLRQDPDVIYVGEIRDLETADLAYKAAMTGHLVLTTLHTNNAHESIDRLAREGINPGIIATNTTALVAQRLVRSLCPHCKKQYRFSTDSDRVALYGANRLFKGDSEHILYKASGTGCTHCGVDSGGLKGRRGVLEILELTPVIQEAILNGMSPFLLRRSSIADGSFRDLWDDGLRLVLEGVVSFEELEHELKPYMNDRASGIKAPVLVQHAGHAPPASAAPIRQLPNL